MRASSVALPLNTLLLGDFRSALAGQRWGSIGFCLTGPPYLVNYRDRSGRTLAGGVSGNWLASALRRGAPAAEARQPGSQILRLDQG